MIFIFLHSWFLEIVAVSSPEHGFWKSPKNDAIKKSSILLIFKTDDTPNEILTFLMFRWLARMVAMPFFLLRRSRCVGVFWRAVLEMTVFVTFAAFSFGNKNAVVCAKTDNDLYVFWDSVPGGTSFIVVSRTLIRVDVGFLEFMKLVPTHMFVLFYRLRTNRWCSDGFRWRSLWPHEC